MAALGIATIIAGLFLAGVPFLFEFISDTAAINAIVCGMIAVFLGALRLLGVRSPAVGYVQAALGIWLMASSAFIGDIPREVWAARSVGLAIFFCGIIGLERPPRDSTSNL